MRKQTKHIEFVMRDSVDGVEITPTTISLSRFNEFNNQVEDFITGSERLSTIAIAAPATTP